METSVRHCTLARRMNRANIAGCLGVRTPDEFEESAGGTMFHLGKGDGLGPARPAAEQPIVDRGHRVAVH
jgi:hypothetical protein